MIAGVNAFVQLDSVVLALDELDGGFTFDLHTGTLVTEGFAVSTRPECEQIETWPLRPGAIDDYALRHLDSLAERGNVLGAWRNPDDGLIYLDVSTVVGTEYQAQALARRHGQLAYFDFARMVSVPVAVPAQVAA